MVPEPKHAQATTAQVVVSHGIANSSIRFRMLTTVELYYQSGLTAVEVRRVGPDTVLTAELGPAQLPVAEEVPELPLRVGA